MTDQEFQEIQNIVELNGMIPPKDAKLLIDEVKMLRHNCIILERAAIGWMKDYDKLKEKYEPSGLRLALSDDRVLWSSSECADRNIPAGVLK